MRLNWPTEHPPRVEILPLIDIVFLLLVFFIFAMLSMTVNRGIDVHLPAASTAEVKTEEHLCLTIRKDGALFVGKDPVEWIRLGHVLKDKVHLAGEDTLLIRADTDVAYARVFKTLDQARIAGFQNISLQAETEP